METWESNPSDQESPFAAIYSREIFYQLLHLQNQYRSVISMSIEGHN